MAEKTTENDDYRYHKSGSFHGLDNAGATGMTELSPILMHPDEVIGVKQAARHARRSQDTIRRWCRSHKISRQSCSTAPLEISVLALEMVLHSDWAALEDLRAGRREKPNVSRYLDHLGLRR